MRSSKQGFTLLELVVTLAIVAILATVGFNFYSAHIIKTRRKHAELALLQLANRLEALHSIEGSYKNVSSISCNDLIRDNSYILQIKKAEDNAFEIVAVPHNSQTSDKQCGALTLNEKSERFIAGSDTIANCWI